MIKERTELATSALSGLLDFWLTKSLDGQPPVPSSIAPADLRPWKDNIVIFEVIGDDDFVYSYYGKELAAAFGHSRLGATLDDLPEEQRAILRPEYESVRRERLPVARVYTADFSGVMRTWERLVLPMSSDGEHIDKLLVAAYEMTAGTTTPHLVPVAVDTDGDDRADEGWADESRENEGRAGEDTDTGAAGTDVAEDAGVADADALNVDAPSADAPSADAADVDADPEAADAVATGAVAVDADAPDTGDQDRDTETNNAQNSGVPA